MGAVGLKQSPCHPRRRPSQASRGPNGKKGGAMLGMRFAAEAASTHRAGGWANSTLTKVPNLKPK